MYNIVANVQGHYESMDSLIYYTISITHLPSNKSWIINRRLDEFHSLYESLSVKYKKKLQYPPGYSTFSYLNSFFSSPIAGLNTFINEILNLPGIYACEEIFQFFNLNLHLNVPAKISPVLTHELTTRFVTFFISLSPDSIFFVDVDQSMRHTIENYLMNIGYSGSEISVIRCYCNNSGWNISLSEKVTAFQWNQSLSIIAAGFEEGSINFYRITNEGKEFSEFLTKVVHNGKVIDFFINHSNSKVYSIGEDAMLMATSLKDNNFYQESHLNFVPISVKVDIDSNLVYIASNKTQIYVYDGSLLENLKVIQVKPFSFITFFEYSADGTKIVGGNQGEICIFSSENELQRSFSVATTVNCIKYCQETQIIVVGDANGVVSLWNQHAEIIYMWKAHEFVTFIDIDKNRIATAGKDSLVKIWSY